MSREVPNASVSVCRVRSAGRASSAHLQLAVKVPLIKTSPAVPKPLIIPALMFLHLLYQQLALRYIVDF